MPVDPRLLSLAAVGLLLLALAAAPAPAGQPDRISMRLEVFGPVGVHVVTTHRRIEEAGDRYVLISDLRTLGLAHLFVDVNARGEVRGRLTATSVKPESFRGVTFRDGVTHQDYVDYRADGAVSGGTTPPESEPVSPIPPPAQLRGTVDDLTAYFMVERQMARTGNCTVTIPVYDGRHRYDLRFTDRGEQSLSPAGGQQFSGPIRSCQVQRIDIGGYPSDLSKHDGAREGTISYARILPGDLMLPVRMEMDTEIGQVHGYLAELHGRGVDRMFME